MAHRLDPLLRPRSLAVVGASRRADSVGHTLIRHLIQGGFAGAIYPVNPKYDDIEGLTCTSTLADLPEPPEQAVLAVADARLEAEFEAAIAAGARAVTLISQLVLAEDGDPPLRERIEDIPELVRCFLARAADEGLPWKIIDNAAMDRLKGYHWPGNVRELENLVKRLAALYSQEVITVDDIDAELADASPAAQEAERKGLSKTVEQRLSTYFSAHAGGLPAAGLYQRVLKEVERPLITLTLQATRGNQIRAAEVLGLNRNTLRKKIRELNIPVIRGAK